jgi:hypothetical protein
MALSFSTASAAFFWNGSYEGLAAHKLDMGNKKLRP